MVGYLLLLNIAINTKILCASSHDIINQLSGSVTVVQKYRSENNSHSCKINRWKIDFLSSDKITSLHICQLV